MLREAISTLPALAGIQIDPAYTPKTKSPYGEAVPIQMRKKDPEDPALPTGV